MKKAILEFWVGLFILLGFAALGILAFRVANGGNSFGKPVATYTVYAQFDDIGSLKVQAPIKSAGVLVGRVSDIQLDPQTFQAKVSMQIEQKYAYSVDANAAILTSGLLGEQYIGLTQGGEEEKLKIRHAVAFFKGKVNIHFKTQFSNDKIITLLQETYGEF